MSPIVCYVYTAGRRIHVTLRRNRNWLIFRTKAGQLCTILYAHRKPLLLDVSGRILPHKQILRPTHVSAQCDQRDHALAIAICIAILRNSCIITIQDLTRIKYQSITRRCRYGDLAQRNILTGVQTLIHRLAVGRPYDQHARLQRRALPGTLILSFEYCSACQP